jgi:hypothetical protein
MTIHVTDATCLDLAGLPSATKRIWVCAAGCTAASAKEEIRICGTTATSGAADLTVCYDGRGINDASNLASIVGAQAWSSGAVVGQNEFLGTGTTFSSTLAPGGVPGPIGPVKYSTGTVTLTPGSTTMTGSGTTWTTSANASTGDAIRVPAHSTSAGVDFIFVAYVSAITNNTTITMSRAFPTDADMVSGGDYKIIKPWYRYFVGHFDRQSPYAGDALSNWGTTGCEDDTHCYGNNYLYHDITAYNGTHHCISTCGDGLETGQYSFQDNDGIYLNSGSIGGVNFYGEDLAWRSFYHRSGLTLALTMANDISDHWVRYPTFAGFTTGGYSPLFLGGGVLGASAAYALGEGTITVNDLRYFWNDPANVTTTYTCNSGDSRDGGYLESWVGQGARYDPDTTSTDGPGGIPWRTRFRNLLSALDTFDDSCANANGGADTNSWASTGTRWTNGSNSTLITLTDGSATGTGTGLIQAINPGSGNATHPNCDGVDIVTVSVMNGSADVTATAGTFTAGVTDIVLDARFFGFSRTDSTHGILASLWPGSTGSASGMTRNIPTGQPTEIFSFGTSLTDPTLHSNYSCKWVSSTQITLDRPFVKDASHSSPDTYSMYSNLLSGHGQQPYMLGIKTYHFWQASALDAALGTTFGAKAIAAGTWEHDYGFDSATRTVNYGRVFQFCESGGIPNATNQFSWTSKACQSGYSISNIVPQRQLGQEAIGALIQWYLNDPTDTNRAVVDQYYGAIWCNSSFDDASISTSCDASSVGNNQIYSNLSDPGLAAGKYPGQMFGVGKAHEWPAVRLGGVPSAVPQTVNATCNISSVTNATKCRVTLTKPDGSTVTNTCTTSPCAVTADARQGDHLLKVEYLSASNAVLASGEPEPVRLH